MVVNELYYGSSACRDNITTPKAVTSGISISDDIIAAALRNIYQSSFNPHTDIEPNLFNAIAHTLGDAVTTATTALGADPFIHALRHSTDVFAAFKTHRAQNDMAARLLDSNGNLKPFEQWRDEVLPIASHQCHNWLETEYNTAVLRARQAANWQQFQQEKDILPNLKWLPSTSPNPGADHRPFWNTILPIDHPFWDQHRPGDRWNCKCDLTSTDEPATPVPNAQQLPSHQGEGPGVGSVTPQPGLTDNPGKSQAVFSDDHPYFPADCKHCAFYNPTIKARLATVFTARVKDCYHCPYINGCINEVGVQQKQLLEERRTEYHRLLNDPNYKNVQFDEKTGGVKATHVGHNERDNEKDEKFFGNMTSADLEGECQDLLFGWGHKAILRNEKILKHNGDFASCLDLELDDVIMDIASITSQESQYGSALMGKNSQIKRARQQSGDNSDSVLLYFHESSFFSERRLINDIAWYKGFATTCGSEQRIHHIYVAVKGEKRLRKYDI